MARSRRGGKDERTMAEVVTLGISLALLAALVGTIAWLELQHGDEPARFGVRLEFDRAFRHGDDWYLPVTTTNEGERTTDRLVVTVEQELAGGTIDDVDLEYDFVAGGEQVTGTVVLDEEPTASAVTGAASAITHP